MTTDLMGLGSSQFHFVFSVTTSWKFRDTIITIKRTVECFWTLESQLWRTIANLEKVNPGQVDLMLIEAGKRSFKLDLRSSRNQSAAGGSGGGDGYNGCANTLWLRVRLAAATFLLQENNKLILPHGQQLASAMLIKKKHKTYKNKMSNLKRYFRKNEINR